MQEEEWQNRLKWRKNLEIGQRRQTTEICLSLLGAHVMPSSGLIISSLSINIIFFIYQILLIFCFYFIDRLTSSLILGRLFQTPSSSIGWKRKTFPKTFDLQGSKIKIIEVHNCLNIQYFLNIVCVCLTRF